VGPRVGVNAAENRKISCPFKSRDSSLGIATGYGLNFHFSMSPRPALGFTGAPSLGVKRQGREADHLPPASTEVKKMWIYTSTPPYAFMA
jgi:hypothetical protein